MGDRKGKDMEIDTLILEGKGLEEISDKQGLQYRYKLWCGKVRICMEETGLSEKEQKKVGVKMHYVDNGYSEDDAVIAIKRSLGDTIQALEESLLISEDKMDRQRELLLIVGNIGNRIAYNILCRSYSLPIWIAFRASGVKVPRLFTGS